MSFHVIVMLPPPADERPDDFVDAHYVAARFGCSASAVRHRLCGTGDIPRVSDDPLRFRRGDVHEVQRRILEARATPEQKAERLLKPRRTRVKSPAP